MTRLPGNYQYQGHDPDGYMTASETIKFFQEYADSFHAPIKTYTEVINVERSNDGEQLRVLTNRGAEYKARNVVIATGFCDQARVLDYARHIPLNILQLDPSDYHRPSQLPPGNVLIVGASATGCQIAKELLD
jgi:putative flavoprotein involved in K+ transport